MLNVNAAPFCPAVNFQASTGAPMPQAQEYFYDDEDELLAQSISDEDLAELEAVDEWVELMADLEASEMEHVKNVALSVFPAAAEMLEEEVRSAGRARKARR